VALFSLTDRRRLAVGTTGKDSGLAHFIIQIRLSRPGRWALTVVSKFFNVSVVFKNCLSFPQLFHLRILLFICGVV